MTSDPLPLILLLLGLFTVSATLRRQRQHPPLPPGPRGLPFLGNIFQVNALRLHLKFKEWAEQYGEIFTLRFGSQTVIVLNTPEAAYELFVARGTKHASKPVMRVAQDIVSAGQRVGFMQYGKEWKSARQSFRDAIGPSQMKSIRSLQELESRTLLHDLLCHGDQSIAEPQACGDEVPDGHWFALLGRYSFSVALNIVYGQRVGRIHGDARMQKLFAATSNLVRVGQPLVDSFPILDFLPDWAAPWRAPARVMHEQEMELWGGLFAEAKASPHATGYVPSYLQQRAAAGFAHAPGCGLVDSVSTWMRDDLVTYNAATLLEAGTDTTAGTLQAAFLLLLSHPHTLQKARDELDAVVGSERLPEFGDEDHLPYVRACVQELLRRRPIIPMTSHAAVEDDVYKGFFIPKGATVVGNMYAMQMDPKYFPDPLEFRPERFLNPSSPVDIHTFSWGRRQCPGRAIAEGSLFLALARIIWALDLHAPKLPDPADESPEGAWSDGFVNMPRLFGVAFKAREGRGAIVRAAYDAAQLEWETLGLEVDLR